MLLSLAEKIWHPYRVYYYVVLVPEIFGLNLLIAFCTKHVLINVLVEILGHTMIIHIYNATIESFVTKHHFTV